MFPKRSDEIRKEETKNINAAYPYMQLQDSKGHTAMVEQAVQEVN